jgi:hypothetical protein
MEVPNTLTELFEHVARETARMSYPGSMSRGNTPVVHKGTKATLEEYFATKFPLREVWLSASQVADRYEEWHQTRTAEIAKAIETHVSKRNNPMAVAAKFLNTFMHQLMKYEPCRALWPALHLPLDARVFAALAQLQSPSLSGVQPLFSQSPYSLPYVAHLDIQRALGDFLQELNARPRAEFKIGSRIELNWLWI